MANVAKTLPAAGGNAPIPKSRLVLAAIVFTVILCALRIGWTYYQSPPPYPKPAQGRVNLQEWDFAGNRPISLTGEWEFYPGHLLAPTDFAGAAGPTPGTGSHGAGGHVTEEAGLGAIEPIFVRVPGGWTGSMPEMPESGKRMAYGSATYRLVAEVPPGQTYALRIPIINSASTLYVNGKKVGGSGRPGHSPDEYAPGNHVYFAEFPADDTGRVEIILQAANFHHPWHGGITEQVKMGSRDSMEAYRVSQGDQQLIVIMMMIMHGAYTGILYALGVRQRAVLFFGVMMLAGALMVSLLDDQLLMSWFSISFHAGVRLLNLSMIGMSTSLLVVLSHLTPGPGQQVPLFHRSPGDPGTMLPALRIPTAIFGLMAVPVLILPSNTVLLLSPVIGLVHLLVLTVGPLILMGPLRWAGRHALFLLLAMIAYTLNALWGLANNFGAIDIGFYPVDFVIAFVALSASWFQSYVSHFRATENMARRLKLFNELKDRFLARTAHEIRNPLHGMMSIAESVIEDLPRGDTAGKEQRRAVPSRSGGMKHGGDTPYETFGRPHHPAKDISPRLELIVDIGHRVASTLDDLLDLPNIEKGTLSLQLGAVSLAETAEPILQTLTFMRGGKSVEIVNEIPPHLPLLNVDADRLSQILFNLLHNSLKFTDHGVITLKAAPSGDAMVRISVTDTGRGMDLKSLLTAFKDYSRSDDAAGDEGYGLGLGVVEHLVELHGGALEVESAPEAGTTIAFTMPVAAPGEGEDAGGAQREAQLGDRSGLTTEAPTAKTASLPGEIRSSRRRVSHGQGDKEEAGKALSDTAPNIADGLGPAVLVVDDDEVNLAVLREALDGHVGHIATVTSGFRALELLSRREWDLVIADIMMPGISGLHLTRVIRERFTVTELPILLLTALARPEDVEAGFRAGANDYLRKPVSRAELLSRAMTAITLKQSAQDHVRMETALLQAQIKPHFLFNTLNSIAALSVIDNDRMRRLIQVFGSYLQSSFDFRNTHRLVPLTRELNMVDVYLYIQKERFGDRLKIVRKIDVKGVEADKILVPPFSIQPLVENAIGHGLMSRFRGGTVTVQVERRGGGLQVTVKDDGLGIADVDTLREIVKGNAPYARSAALEAAAAGEEGPRRRGVGMWNTNRRLEQVFGSGLIIESTPGEGTTVSFYVPPMESGLSPREL